jgi:zinc transporter ZupT
MFIETQCLKCFFRAIINQHFISWEAKMDISRRLGILVFCGVPAIIGGGIIYAIFGSLTPIWIYEVLLLVTAGALVSR